MAPTFGLSLSAVCLALFSSVAPVYADDITSNAAAACTRLITAKLGDSCVSVSQANSLTVTQFLQINPTVRSCTLSVGVTYCVSTDPAAAAGGPPAPPASSPSTTLAVPPTATPTPIKPAPPSSSSASVPHAPPTSSVSTSVGAAPSSGSTGLVASPDGSDGICGGQYTCLGSVYGQCCSANGYCGNTTEYCGEGCNPAYGECGLCPAAAAGSATATVTAFFTTTSILVSTSTALVTVTAPAVTVTHTVTQAAAPPPTTTTARPPGVATPSPTFPGVTRNCVRWYLVRATDNCRRVALTYGTTQAQIVAWNPSVSQYGGGCF